MAEPFFTNGPVDVTGPFNAAAEALRKRVVALAQESEDWPEMQALSDEDKLLCMTAGLMTGCVGALLCHIDAASHDDFMLVLDDWLPEARQASYDIMANAPEARFQ